jgi:hypothetical protein
MYGDYMQKHSNNMGRSHIKEQREFRDVLEERKLCPVDQIHSKIGDPAYVNCCKNEIPELKTIQEVN